MNLSGLNQSSIYANENSVYNGPFNDSKIVINPNYEEGRHSSEKVKQPAHF